MIVETVAFIVGVVVLFGLGSYLVRTSDRRTEYLDRKHHKHDRDFHRDFYKWL